MVPAVAASEEIASDVDIEVVGASLQIEGRNVEVVAAAIEENG